MGLRFFSKRKNLDGRTVTIESPGQCAAQLDYAKSDPSTVNDTYLIPAPLDSALHPEKVKHILTLEDAVAYMVATRPDVLTSDFEDGFLGHTSEPPALLSSPVPSQNWWGSIARWFKVNVLRRNSNGI